MSIDPQIQPLVDANNAANAELPPIWDQTVEQKRAGYLALAELAGPGPDLATIEDVEIAGVRCRIYADEDPQGVLMYTHGGGFVMGDLNTHDEPCRQVALESGATVIAVDYRRAPEHPFPAAIDDSWAVLQAIDADRDRYGADAIIVIGDSVGASCAAVMAIMARDAGIDLALQLLIYPLVDVLDASPSLEEFAEGFVFTRETLDWFNHNYQPDPHDWRASPLRAPSHAGLAPAVVITAEYDPVRDQGIAYVKKLADAGVDVTHSNYEGMVHAFFQLGPLVDSAKIAVTQVSDAARRALRRTRG